MTRTALTVAAALAAVVALAGCGGGGGATTAATTAGSSGMQTTTSSSATLRSRVQSLEARLQSALTKLRNGNLGAAAAVGTPILTHCRSTVNGRIAPLAATDAQRAAVSHLRLACKDMSKAAAKGASGNLSATKQLAGQALLEVKDAVKQLG